MTPNLKRQDEYYTQKKDVEYFIDKIKTIDKNSVIGCPFDKDESEFVKVLRERGYKVINSHIDEGKDFFVYEPNEKGDVIISNPPFSVKKKVIERIIEIGNKPFALIFGTQALNCGGFIESLNNLKRKQIVLLKKRMRFVNPDEKLQNQPSFSSVGICNDLIDNDFLIFEGV